MPHPITGTPKTHRINLPRDKARVPGGIIYNPNSPEPMLGVGEESSTEPVLGIREDKHLIYSIEPMFDIREDKHLIYSIEPMLDISHSI